LKTIFGCLPSGITYFGERAVKADAGTVRTASENKKNEMKNLRNYAMSAEFLPGGLPSGYQLPLKMPLLAWDIICQTPAFLLANSVRHESAVLEGLLQAKKLTISMQRIKPFLRETGTAVILTDSASCIQWVSNSFFSMTGYRPHEAIDRTPRFLQGPLSSDVDRAFIRHHLTLHQPFETTVTNYRKNGEVYYCNIHIYPVSDIHDNVTNFLALEREVACV
jgi:PAS domain S-box-containing protein